jgi:hypothetical protein
MIFWLYMDAAQLFIIARSDAVFYCRTPAVSLANNNESASGRAPNVIGSWRRLQATGKLQAVRAQAKRPRFPESIWCAAKGHSPCA